MPFYFEPFQQQGQSGINWQQQAPIQGSQVIAQLPSAPSGGEGDGGIGEIFSGLSSLIGGFKGVGGAGGVQAPTSGPGMNFGSQQISSAIGTPSFNQPIPTTLQNYVQKGVNMNLDPAFQEKLPMILEDLRQQGYQPMIASGFRTREEQMKKVREGASHTMHSNHMTGNAVDIVDSRYGWNTKKYNNEIKGFADAMAKTTAKYGLESGTKWKSFGPYGDFAHVQYRPQKSGQGGGGAVQQPQLIGQSRQQAQMQNQLTIPSVVKAAQTTYADNPTMAAVAASQAILESRLNGNPSGLAKQNNLFGIKGSGTAGTVSMKTQEYGKGGYYSTNAGFAKNATVEDSFLQHQKLMQNKRYEAVRSAKTPEEAFRAMQQSGYATDPRYGEKLQQIYEKYVAPAMSQPEIGPQSMNAVPDFSNGWQGNTFENQQPSIMPQNMQPYQQMPYIDPRQQQVQPTSPMTQVADNSMARGIDWGILKGLIARS